MMDAKNLLRDVPKGEVTVKGDHMQVVFRRRYAKLKTYLRFSCQCQSIRAIPG